MNTPRTVNLAEVLEPEAIAKMAQPGEAIQISQAISLKRIADQLERLVDVASTPIADVTDAG